MTQHMRRLQIAPLLLLLVSSTFSFSQPTSDQSYKRIGSTLFPLPHSPIAAPDPIVSIFGNPAGIGIGREGGLFVSRNPDTDQKMVFTPEGFGAALVLREGIGLAWENAIGDSDYRRYTFGIRRNVIRGFDLGVAYHWFDNQDRKSDLDAGFILRPTSRVSLAMVGRNLASVRIGPYAPDQVFTIGTSLLPRIGKHNNVVFSIESDFVKAEQENNQLHYPRASATFAPVEGIMTQIGYDWESRVASAGISLSIENLSFGQLQGFRTTNRGSRPSSSTYMLYRDRTQHSVMNRFYPKHMVKIELRNKIARRVSYFSLFCEKGKSVNRIIQAINEMRQDDRVAGLLIDLDRPELTFDEMIKLHDALLDFKSANKEVVVYGHRLEVDSYYIASAADKLYLAPKGSIQLSSLSFPSASETIAMVPENSEGEVTQRTDELLDDTLTSVLAPIDYSWKSDGVNPSGFWNVWVADVSSARGMEPEVVKNWVGSESYRGSNAESLGLIDAVLSTYALNRQVINGVGLEDALVITPIEGYIQPEVSVQKWESLSFRRLPD